MVSIYYLFAALNTAFGSLYCDEVVVTPATVVPILAAGHLLQLVRI